MSFSLIRDLLMYIVLPALMMYLFEAYTHDPFVSMRAGVQLLNILLFIAINSFFFFIFGKLNISLRIMSVIFMVMGLAEYYLVEFRGVTLLPWDIGSLGIAAEVASGYDYMLNIRAILCAASFVIIFVISGFAGLTVSDIAFISGKTPGTAIAARITGAALSLLFVVCYTFFVQTEIAKRTFGFNTKLYTPTALSYRDGTLTAFLMELAHVRAERPAGYSQGEASRMLEEYKGARPALKANIIVIMNEAFSDLSVLGDFSTDRDYMPFVHSLMEETSDNVISGELNVSIVGGNTPNTEFEFLTGNTLAFLPEGSIPYQQYVNDGIYAMPSYLRDMGYNTVGMHPYYAKGWGRERVYPLLGFQRSLFIEDFDEEASKVRGYISDMACSEQIIAEYVDNKKSGRPLFAFLVTMQNHSPYDEAADDLIVDVNIEGRDDIKNIQTTERYLTLIKKSDEAFRYLTEYFADKDDPTIIVMFGDHGPSDSVVRPIWKIAGRDPGNLTEDDVERRYLVPYVIWANYDIAGTTGRDSSANFLGNIVLDAAGAGRYPYRSFIDKVMDRYEVFSAIRAVGSDGSMVSDKALESDPLILEYKKLQYHELFGKYK